MRLINTALCSAVLLALSSAAAAGTEHPAVGRALGLLQANGAAARLSADDAFTARDVIIDVDGTEHVRFDRTYQGLPVIGGDVVVHARGNSFRGASVTLDQPLRVNARATVSSDTAIARASAAFNGELDALPTARLAVYARERGAGRLVWEVTVVGTLANGNPSETHIVIDGNSGRQIDRWDQIHTAASAGTARTLYSGNVSITTDSVAGGFALRDPSRGNGYTVSGAKGRNSGQIYNDADNTWGNNSMSDAATAAVDAQFGVAMTWDYFKLTHGRNGIANDGKGAYNKVHYGNSYVNAYWSDSCFCMTYGDGDGVTYGPLVNLDVAGHEMSHGVTSRSANLTYSGESGGLNEATSDIFGAMVEFFANNASDVPDYLIGEEIYLANVSGSANQKALRYMYNPIKDTRSPNCYSSTLGSLDVHYSSGVANHFFYLLAEGSGAKTFNGVDHTSPTCNGSSLAGIGRDAAGKIWYRALTVYMTSNTNYAGARTATLKAAADLYGNTSSQYAGVAAAWSAVAVN